MNGTKQAFTPLLFFFCSVLTVSSCVSENDRALLASVFQHWQQWQSQQITSYQYEFQRICFCLDEVTQPVTITVIDGQIASIVNSANGTTVTPNDASLFLTVDQLFSLLVSSLEQGVDSLSVRFDKVYSYPVRMDVDPYIQFADDEYSIVTANLRPL